MLMFDVEEFTAPLKLIYLYFVAMETFPLSFYVVPLLTRIF